MAYEINDTTDYHRRGLETLGWELTVCNALEPADSPCRRILRRPDSYGHLLYDYLGRFIPLRRIRTMIEIGGGYGYLTRDFLDRNDSIHATMLDLSPCLLQRQRSVLKGHAAAYRQADILDLSPGELRPFDLAVLNESAGDFPTLVNVASDVLTSSAGDLEIPLRRLRHFFDRYALASPGPAPFNANIGAMEVLESLCYAAVPYIFISEHSCEAVVPEPLRRWIRISAPGNPERIRLRGHDEYTVRFSHLVSIARAFAYDVVRGPLADFIEFDFTDELRYILAAGASRKDEQEILRHFVEDLYQYEYLLLVKPAPPGGTSPDGR